MKTHQHAQVRRVPFRAVETCDDWVAALAVASVQAQHAIEINLLLAVVYVVSALMLTQRRRLRCVCKTTPP